MNLKDAPMIPNGMARNMARKRTASNGATVLADQNNTLRDAWQLGDCNNMFVLLLVSKEGDLVFMRKVLSPMPIKKSFIKSYRSTDKTSPCRILTVFCGLLLLRIVSVCTR